VQPNATGKARAFIALGGMAYKVGGLVDDEQVVVFM
jgi:hypothetical protein